MAGSMQKKEGSAASGQASIEKIEVGWFLFWDPAYLSIFRDGNCYMLHMMNLYLHNLCIQLHNNIYIYIYILYVYIYIYVCVCSAWL